jgi:hypothetical protein
MKFKNPLTRDDIFITERPMFRKGMYVYPLRFVVNQNDNLLICPPMKTLFVQFCPTNCTTYIELRSGGNSLFPVGGRSLLNFRQNFQISDNPPPPPPPICTRKGCF